MANRIEPGQTWRWSGSAYDACYSSPTKRESLYFPRAPGIIFSY